MRVELLPEGFKLAFKNDHQYGYTVGDVDNMLFQIYKIFSPIHPLYILVLIRNL